MHCSVNIKYQITLVWNKIKIQHIINYITHDNLYFIGTIFTLNAELKDFLLPSVYKSMMRNILNWNQAQIEIYVPR